jgi:ATP-dependent HslUV protease ATP-binding subunit HslU
VANHSGDASDEGVQRDLLPLIEGSIVETQKYGNVNTEHILFICSGAFSAVKPEDLIPELQGRLPTRVHLKPLSESELRRILTETKHCLLKQQIALLNTEGINLEFTEEAVDKLASFTVKGNREIDNIGARRLFAVVENVMEEFSFKAPLMPEGSHIVITDDIVEERMKSVSDKHKPDNFERYVF